jgi:hypothetical protein
MYLELFIELIHNLNKYFSHYETLVTISTLSHYLFSHKLIRINPKLIRLENYPILIGPSIDPLSPTS